MEKKVLVICTRPPIENISGGQERVFQIIKSIREKKIEVDLISLTQRSLESSELKVYDKLKVNYTFIKHSYKEYFTGLIYWLVNFRIPLNVALYRNSQIQRLIITKENTYEKIILCGIRSASYKFKSNPKIVIDFTDCISQNYLFESKNHYNSFFVRLIYKIEYKLTRLFENQCLENFKTKIAITSYDAKCLDKDQKIHVIPNYISINQNLTLNTSRKDSKKIKVAYFGKMDYLPNKHAIEWFIENVKPFVNNIELNIIGRNSDGLRIRDDDVILAGYVKDIDKYLSGMDIFIAPLISGMGLQNKILHYMKFNKPILMSSICFRGLVNDKKLRNVHVFDEPQQYINFINKFTFKQNLQSNHEYLNKHYSFDAVANSWIKHLL